MKVIGLMILPLCWAAAEPASVTALIGEARSAPAELAADALIRIAGTNAVERDRKMELLEDAFQRAAGAQQPYRRRAALARSDGMAAYWNRVYGQELDRLTLQSRAVAAMLPLDRGKARELLGKIPPLKLPRVSCGEYQVYDVERFYDVLGNVARESGDAGPFLTTYAGAVTSAVQVSPMVRTVLAARLKDGELESVVNALAAALGKIGGDDRSFTSAQTIGKDLLELTDELKGRGLSPLKLLEAYRLYLIWNLSAARCADNDLMQGGRLSFGLFTGQPAEAPAGDFISFFNSRLRMAPLQPIGEAEATPARLEGVATGLRLCEDPECQGMVKQLRGLVLGANGIPYPPKERATPEWQARFGGFLEELARWKRSTGASAAEFYREKAQIYGELLSLGADGPNRESAMRALLDFAATSELRKADLLGWYLPVNAVLARLSLDPAGLGKFAAEVRQSKDPLIAWEARVEAAAPRTPERALPLL